MNVAVVSAFRNSTHTLPRYFEQVCLLREALYGEADVRLIAAEGDSTDGTASALIQRAHHHNLNIQCLEVSHGGPVFGSTEAPERMQALSKIGNAMLSAVRPDDDVVFYVESDLIWGPLASHQLIQYASARMGGFDVFAPLVFAGQAFYDVYAFRLNGTRFSPFPPYHEGLTPGFTEVDSVGSCLAMHGDVARRARMGTEALIGFCASARSLGYKIAVASALHVEHPA